MNDKQEYITGTGQRILNIHDESQECRIFGCVIHAPTDHPMKDFPTHWRNDRKVMERICSHGVGHPDPDHLNYLYRVSGEDVCLEGVHGCDGCCHDNIKEGEKDDKS